MIRLDDPVVGEARTTARGASAGRAGARRRALRRPCCIVSSGETTVHVTGAGKGGRNQEFALAAADCWRAAADRRCLASVGTDGIDGPTDAAGAHRRFDHAGARARPRACSPGRYLSDNNAYAFFDALGDLIHTGPTGTNVGDLQVILLA